MCVHYCMMFSCRTPAPRSHTTDACAPVSTPYLPTPNPSYPRTPVPTYLRSHIPSYPRTPVPTYPRTPVPSHPRIHVPTYPRCPVPTYPRSHVPPTPRTPLTHPVREDSHFQAQRLVEYHVAYDAVQSHVNTDVDCRQQHLLKTQAGKASQNVNEVQRTK